MKSHILFLALLLAGLSRLPAQQDPAALLVLSHALDSKLAFTTSSLGQWEVVSDPGAVSGTALKIGAYSRQAIESSLEGPASIRFLAKGGFDYGIRPVFPVIGLRFSTPESNDRPTVWREYRFTIPAGRHQLFWEGYGFEKSSFLDAVIVNLPLDEAAVRQALDYSGEVTFPTAGQWTVDSAESVLHGASLRQPAYSRDNQMAMTVAGPAALRYALQIGGAGSISGLSVRIDTREVYQSWGLRLYKWLPMGLFVPEGTHQISFLNPSNNGVVWMDALAVEPAGTGLAEALDYAGPWTVSGPYPWHAQPALIHAGPTAAAVTYPSSPAGGTARLGTRVKGPGILSFQSSYQGTYGTDTVQAWSHGIKVELNGGFYAATMPVLSNYPVTSASWQTSRLHIPPGEHQIALAVVRQLQQSAALYLLDSVQVEPVPTPALREALDSSLPWESTGVHVPIIKAAPNALGGTLLESPANRTGSCQVSLPVRGPARFRFRFSHGAVPSESSYPTPTDRVSLFRNGLNVTLGTWHSWPTAGGTSTTHELDLPEGDLELVMDLKDRGAIQAIPVQWDAATILTASGESFAKWAERLSLTASDRQLDNDKDQRTNFFEYALGTQPYQSDDRSDILVIEPAAADRAAQLGFKWLPDRIDAAWAIQESNDLISWKDRWVPLATQAVPAKDGFMIWRVAVPVDGKKRWFRAIARAATP